MSHGIQGDVAAVSEYMPPSSLRDHRGDAIPCQICAYPAYISFEMGSTCNDTRIGRFIWHFSELDIDHCNAKGHTTVLLLHDSIASLRELWKELKEISGQNDLLEKKFILLERGTVPQLQTDRERSRKQWKWASSEKKREGRSSESWWFVITIFHTYSRMLCKGGNGMNGRVYCCYRLGVYCAMLMNIRR